MGKSDGRAVPLYAPKDVWIELHWNDRGKAIKTFSNVHDLAQFLKDNPLLAEAVGYVARSPKLNKLKMPDFFMSVAPSEQSVWVWRARDTFSRKGSVEMDGTVFESEKQFEDYLKKIMNAR